MRKIIIRLTTFLLLSLGISVQASAAPLVKQSPYITIGGFANYISNLTPTTDILVTIPDPNNPDTTINTPITEITNNLGGGATLSFGYKYQSIRGEAQVLYSYARYKRIKVLNDQDIDSLAQVRTRGDASIFAGLFNVLLDFDFLGNERNEFIFVPYIGGGAGYANIQNTPELNYSIIDPETTIPNFKSSLSESSVAYQGIIGARIYMDSVSSVNLDYRILSIGSLSNFKSLNMHSINLTFSFMLDKKNR
jgi:opacity protein-like surface antigen